MSQRAAGLTASIKALRLPMTSLPWAQFGGGGLHQPHAVGITRLGELAAPKPVQDFRLPALLHLPGATSVLLKADPASKAAAARAVQSLAARLLATIPPGKLRFTFVDPVGLGQNVAPFMHLADYDEALVTGKAWSEPMQIEAQLAALAEHMENVIQKYLRNQFATIEEYNAQAGEVAEAYRVLLVFDFPANFTEASARRLVSIAQNGPRCGVYAIVLVDTSKPLPYGFNLADLESAATVIAWDGAAWRWRDPDFQDFTLTLDEPPPAALLDRIIKAAGEGAKQASIVQVPFERIAPPRERWWDANATTADSLRVKLGPSGATKVQELELGGRGTAHHALLVGKTGSGKSTLMHTIITNLALTYSPDEVQLYLVDFKKGVEFQDYARCLLPHARVVAIESEREFGLSVLQGLKAEGDRRGKLFTAAGVNTLADYRARTREKLPRVLLLVDEFQVFFSDDDAIASQATQLLDELVRQGRSFGIHVLLASQTLAGSYSLPRTTVDQMGVRIALQCSDADSRLILSDDNPAARLLERPGQAIYNNANGRPEGNNPFQVAYLEDERRAALLAELQAFAAQKLGRYTPPIIFEGNAPAQIEKNAALNALLAGRPLDAKAPLAWLGDPIAIRDPLAAAFRKQAGANLLIVGQNEEAAFGLFSAALLALAAQAPTGDAAAITLLDFSQADEANADFYTRLATRLPRPITLGKRRQLPALLDELAAEVTRRMEDEAAPGRPRFLFVHGLQRARDLRQEEGLGSFAAFDAPPAAVSPAQQFATILREGPDVGIHTLVWCDTMTNLNRTLDRRALREFGLRVAFQMSAEDSSALLDTPAAGKLGPYRALFYSEDEGRLEKFRPYGAPADAWSNT
ncbi:FtsK/SpoIIIE domain-containing protein [Candidatus Amarolinea aalborgensis]|uniref:FtsK/SpoIIIE domain-containing protein n=1 Tax=Candidatus Amarolinea aalborgensis TaxID=2249329 RepID=UPI003BFA0E61